MRRRLARTCPSNSRIHQAIKEALVDKVGNVVVSNRVAVSPGVIACQVALNLVKGGTQDYLGAVCSVLLEQAANTEESLQNLAFARLRLILGGETSVLLYGDLLERNNHADQLILKDT